MKDIWVVTLESKDKQKYEFKTLTFSEEDAKKKALENIVKRGWFHFDYKVIAIEKKKA